MNKYMDTGYPLEYEGQRDSKYGGIITDVNKLPIGTKFYVCNGAWTGRICQDDIGKYISIEDNRICRLNDKPYLLSLHESSIVNTQDNTTDIALFESPCKNCMESYCYKNCDKYTEWENKAEVILKAYTASGLDKFLISKEVLIEFKSGYGTHKDRTLYRCPTCKQNLSKSICESKNKITYCYNCGQLLKFKGEDINGIL